MTPEPSTRITLREWLRAGRDMVICLCAAAFVYGCWYIVALAYEWGR